MNLTKLTTHPAFIVLKKSLLGSAPAPGAAPSAGERSAGNAGERGVQGIAHELEPPTLVRPVRVSELAKVSRELAELRAAVDRAHASDAAKLNASVARGSSASTSRWGGVAIRIAVCGLVVVAGGVTVGFVSSAAREASALAAAPALAAPAAAPPDRAPLDPTTASPDRAPLSAERPTLANAASPVSPVSATSPDGALTFDEPFVISIDAKQPAAAWPSRDASRAKPADKRSRPRAAVAATAAVARPAEKAEPGPTPMVAEPTPEPKRAAGRAGDLEDLKRIEQLANSQLDKTLH
jgi:hypothetical protein